jgi:hypothetical protein
VSHLPPPPPPLPPHFRKKRNNLYLSPCSRTRDDAAAAAAPAAAAVRFLSKCLLLHAVKFTRKGREAEAWRAVAAAGISQQELQAAKVRICFQSLSSLLMDSCGFAGDDVMQMMRRSCK